MPDINLLPQDLRRQEEKEISRLARKTRTFDVELSGGVKNKPVSIVESKPKASLWSKIFGQNVKRESKKMPEKPVLQQSSVEIDMLSAARKQKINLSPGKKNNIVSKSAVPTVKVPVIAVKEPVKKTEDDKAKDGWSQIFRSIFGGHQAALPKIVDTAFNSPAQTPKKESGVPKNIDKVESKSKYTTVPKGNKSKFNINLIPEELAFRKHINRKMQSISMVFAIILPSLIVYGLYAVLQAYQNNIDRQITAKQTEIIRLNEKVASYKIMKDRNIDLQQKLLAIKGLHDEHIYWTNFFKLLEKYTLDGVQFTNFSADIGGEFSLPAIAGSYEEAAKQIVVLRQATDFIKDVKVDRVSLRNSGLAGITGVDFELKIKINDGVFNSIKKQP